MKVTTTKKQIAAVPTSVNDALLGETLTQRDKDMLAHGANILFNDEVLEGAPVDLVGASQEESADAIYNSNTIQEIREKILASAGVTV